MPYAAIPMTPANFEVSHIYKLNAVKTPQSCVDLSLKVSNIRKKIKSIEDIAAGRLATNDKISGLTKAVLIAGVVQDTCVAFLDMAGALLPGKVEKVAKGGVYAITSAETGSELYFGQTTKTAAAHKMIDATIGMAPSTTPAAKVRENIAKTQSGIVGVAISSQNGGDKKAAAKKFAINASFDKVNLMLDLGNPSDNPMTKKVGIGLKLAQAALNYEMALEKRTDAYWNEKTDLVVQKAEIEMRTSQYVSKLTKELNAALAEFEACVN